MTTPLAAEITRLIALEGPISVARYMSLCLSHPRHGYYMSRDPFGAEGDFTTAPEISQMFGELAGLWAASVWLSMGAPAGLALVELGPGRGTLMADALRATRRVPGFQAAASVHLVETSPVLRERQKAVLAAHAAPISWHDSLDTVPDGPLIVIANEFFDALPVRQFVRTEKGWCERAVGLDGDGKLCFGLLPQPEPSLGTAAPVGRPRGGRAHPSRPLRGDPPSPGGEGSGTVAAAYEGQSSQEAHDDPSPRTSRMFPTCATFDVQLGQARVGWKGGSVRRTETGGLFGASPAPVGAVLEIAEAGGAVMESLARRIGLGGGAALIIDYGHVRTGFGDTLQALRRHAFTDPLKEPGEADLTAHVDFSALARTAEREGVLVDRPVTQGAFLKQLGIEARAERLRANASPAQKAAIDAALARLVGEGADAMGRLFKAMALRSSNIPPTPGFAPDVAVS